MLSLYNILPRTARDRRELYDLQNQRHLRQGDQIGGGTRRHPVGGVCVGLPRLYPGSQPPADRNAGGGRDRSIERNPMPG